MLRINGALIGSLESIHMASVSLPASLLKRLNMYFQQGYDNQGMVWVLEEEVIIGFELLGYNLYAGNSIEVAVDGYKLQMDQCIRLFPDFAGAFAWGWNGGCIADVQPAPYKIPINNVELSESLAKDLFVHQCNFENNYDQEQFDWKQFNKEGRRLAQLVKTELGVYYHVIYEKACEDPVCKENEHTEVRIYASGYGETEPLPCAFYFRIHQTTVAEAFARAWNRLDPGEFTGLLDEQSCYASQWVLQEMKGKKTITDYLTEKMRTVKLHAEINPDFKVRAELATTTRSDTGRPCVYLRQGETATVVLFATERDKVLRIDICEPAFYAPERSGIFPE